MTAISTRAICKVLCASLLLAGSVALQAADRIGTVSSPLVGGTDVSPETQEIFGLLSLDNGKGTCSAQLLRNTWAITAAHCVESTVGPRDTGIKLTAKWTSVQTRQSARSPSRTTR